jgi:DNA-binding HxlR family transcriptional regulator
MFNGVRTFAGLLGAEERIATNILAERLARLEAMGLVCKSGDGKDRRRFRYTLTRKGIELAPMLVELVLWSARHAKTAAPPEVIAAMTQDPRGFAGRIVAEWEAEAVRSAQPQPASASATADARSPQRRGRPASASRRDRPAR